MSDCCLLLVGSLKYQDDSTPGEESGMTPPSPHVNVKQRVGVWFRLSTHVNPWKNKRTFKFRGLESKIVQGLDFVSTTVPVCLSKILGSWWTVFKMSQQFSRVDSWLILSFAQPSQVWIYHPKYIHIELGWIVPMQNVTNMALKSGKIPIWEKRQFLWR